MAIKMVQVRAVVTVVDMAMAWGPPTNRIKSRLKKTFKPMVTMPTSMRVLFLRRAVKKTPFNTAYEAKIMPAAYQARVRAVAWAACRSKAPRCNSTMTMSLEKSSTKAVVPAETRHKKSTPRQKT